jgi:CSLREA domain-containing protein/MYXO-CTERM domain-containing protein
MYRKSLLALFILATLPVTAATDRTIYVNTTVDEDGENVNACSLREALQAATNNRAYGGCIAGQLDITDQIKLKADTYKLKKPLIVTSAATITGSDAGNFDIDDPISNLYPARTPIETVIQPEDGQRFILFDSAVSRAAVNLNNVILKQGQGLNGGAIRAGGSVNLNRVHILNAKASAINGIGGIGGAIYLEGVNAGLNATDSLFEGNNALRGAVIGMSCRDNLGYTQHSINLERTSIVNNGSADSQSIIDFCGTVAGSIVSSTIAKNASNGNILNYVRAADERLHPDSTLTLNSNTIVENGGISTLFYGDVGKLTLTNTVIGYNNGKSCRYALGTEAAANLKASDVAANFNALNETDCELPGYLYKDTNLKFLKLPIGIGSVLNTLADNGGFLPSYLPKPDASVGEKLIDAGEGSCSTSDQRNLTRNISNIGSNPNKCDIGSIEVANLKAADALGVSNGSLEAPIKQYEDNIKFYEDILKADDVEPKVVQRYKNLLLSEQTGLDRFKTTRAYRQAYATVLDTSIEQERYIDNNTKTVFQKFGDDFAKNYTLSVDVIGRGSQQYATSKDAKDLSVIGEASNISCKWDGTLRQILVRRTDHSSFNAVTTPAGDYEYCKYTITSIADANVKSEGLVQARIVNIAPIAKDDDFTLVYGSTQPITLNILANDNDDGDGGPGVIGYPTGYNVFYKNEAAGSFANIKLINKPVLGKLRFEYEQPCPTNSSTRPEETCYGGKITYTPNNAFSTFNDSFTYKVLDQDRAESNEATVKITNTATTTDDTRGSSGGGSVGLFGLFGLAGLILLRRKLN